MNDRRLLKNIKTKEKNIFLKQREFSFILPLTDRNNSVNNKENYKKKSRFFYTPQWLFVFLLLCYRDDQLEAFAGEFFFFFFLAVRGGYKWGR
jgi:hypothetical protein